MLSNSNQSSTFKALMPKEYPYLVWFNFTVNFKGEIISVPIKHYRFSMAKCLLFRLLNQKNYRYVPETLYRTCVKNCVVTRYRDETTQKQFLALNGRYKPTLKQPTRGFGRVSALAQPLAAVETKLCV